MVRAEGSVQRVVGTVGTTLVRRRGSSGGRSRGVEQMCKRMLQNTQRRQEVVTARYTETEANITL